MGRATPSKPGVLLVANWDSNVGYAWWLMESYWATIANTCAPTYEVILAYPTISTIPEAIKQAPITVVERRFGGSSLRSLIDELRFLKQHNIQLIYFSDWDSWRIRYAWYRLAGVKRILIHDHTPGFRTPSTGLKRRLKQVVHQLPLINVDLLIGATAFVRQRYLDVNCAPPERCVVVQNGLPHRMAEPPAADVHARFDIPHERTLIVMTGRASTYKGLDFALSTLQRLLTDDCHNVHLLHCGDGPDLQAFQALAKALGVDEHVTFAGRQNDIPSILRGCDIAFHPSKGEVGYSLSILEYMEAGLPVVVPNNPSVCGATEDGDCGFIYAAGDASSAASAIKRLTQNGDLAKRLGRRGAQAVQEHFSLEVTHQQLLKTFAPYLSTSEMIASSPPIKKYQADM